MNKKSRRYIEDLNKENIQARCRFNSHKQKLEHPPFLHKLSNTKQMKNKQNRTTEQKKPLKQNIHFPKIYQNAQPMNVRKHSLKCRSLKKILTEPSVQQLNEQQNYTLSPQNNMKDILHKIMKNKENRHLASIDEEIDKLDSLTKRYTFLRKDLSVIQENILTISFQIKNKYKRESCQSQSAVLL